MINITDMDSSYIKNKYGEFLYALIKSNFGSFDGCPGKFVEFGCLSGYSSCYIAKAIKDLKLNRKLYCYDLFEDYQFKRCNIETFKTNLNRNRIYNFEAIKTNVFSLKDDLKYAFVHIDISNDGDKLEQLFNKIHKNLYKESLIVFEGGSKERDKIEWMIKYNKKPIKDFIKKYQYKYSFFTINPFPSLTMCKIR